jgi:hypothetical protein
MPHDICNPILSDLNSLRHPPFLLSLNFERFTKQDWWLTPAIVKFCASPDIAWDLPDEL